MDETREALAEYAHEAWAGWMVYFFDKCCVNQSGDMVVPAAYVKGLRRQIDTTYQELSEAEKDSDRKEADKMIAIFAAHNNID